MLPIISLLISVLAISVSILTFSLTFFWGGTLKYSKPSQMWLGYSNDKKKSPIVFFRFYLHSTGLAGKLMHSVFLEIKRAETTNHFSVWNANTGSGYKSLAGLKVPKEGLSLENIFQPSGSEGTFVFNAGEYNFQVFVREKEGVKPKTISKEHITLSESQIDEINAGKYIVFHLNSDGSNYSSYSEEPTVDPNKVLVNDMVEKMVTELDKREKS